MYGNPTIRILKVYFTQGLEFPGRPSRAIRSGRAQICEMRIMKNLLLTLSEYQVQKSSWMSVSTELTIQQHSVPQAQGWREIYNLFRKKLVL